MNGFLVMCLLIISLSINLRYALLASSHLKSDLKPSAQCVAAANKGVSALRQATHTFKHRLIQDLIQDIHQT